ncbi:MAG: site-specific integrase [Bacteroidales bacterium]|nr:site-specific integrase [Bacteroidales bacterium]
MATVKVKFRRSSVDGRPGVIYYQVIHRRVVRHITTDIRVDARCWDADSVHASGNGHMLQARIDSDVSLLNRIISGFDRVNEEYHADDIVCAYRKASCGSIPVLAFMNARICSLLSAGRYGTARNYMRARSSFAMFLGGVDIPLSAVTEQLMSGYSAFLSERGIVRNSVSFYMRILRAVYNRALRQGIVDQAFPFRGVYTGVDRTRKRAVDESMIQVLASLRLLQGSYLDLARDIFIFSYCMRGMAFVDVVYLRRSDIRDGVVCYARRKTGQRLCVRIEPYAQAIIDKHSMHSVPGSPYVFPFLSGSDSATDYRQYQSALNMYNRMLAKLSKMLPDGCHLTSYTSRHSWATAARNHDVPLSVISAAMGHSSERTTQIYLANLENSVIDAANRCVLSGLGQMV